MNKALDCAMRLLTRREHGERELIAKLMTKGYSLIESQEAVSECQRLGLQSDTRFVESFCNLRIQQGYGPLRILQALQSKSLDKELISTTLEQFEGLWEEYALRVWRKKYPAQLLPGFTELQKQQRFLLYRGFSAETIRQLFKNYSQLA